MTADQWRALYDHLVAFEALPKPFDVETAYTDRFLKAVYKDGELRWPVRGGQVSNPPLRERVALTGRDIRRLPCFRLGRPACRPREGEPPDRPYEEGNAGAPTRGRPPAPRG